MKLFGLFIFIENANANLLPIGSLSRIPYRPGGGNLENEGYYQPSLVNEYLSELSPGRSMTSYSKRAVDSPTTWEFEDVPAIFPDTNTRYKYAFLCNYMDFLADEPECSSFADEKINFPVI